MTEGPNIPDPLMMQLDTDERLLWSATPDLAHIHFAWLRLVPGILLFAIATGLMALGINASVESGSATPALFALFSLPFFAAAYSTLTAPFRSKRQLAEAVYGISDRRVMIANGRDGRLFRSVDLNQVCGIQRWQRKDGHGALEIETNGQANGTLVFDIFMLDGLRDPDRAEQLLVNLSDVASTSSTGGVVPSKKPEPVSAATI